MARLSYKPRMHTSPQIKLPLIILLTLDIYDIPDDQAEQPTLKKHFRLNFSLSKVSEASTNDQGKSSLVFDYIQQPLRLWSTKVATNADLVTSSLGEQALQNHSQAPSCEGLAVFLSSYFAIRLYSQICCEVPQSKHTLCLCVC